MREILVQVIGNLKANTLRSVLTMFGILWGVVSVVVLAATGEGFRRGNETVLRELGRNIVIVRGGRTSLQAGGERAGRRIFLTVDDARALATQSTLAAVVSPEIERSGVTIKSLYNNAALDVTGVEPQYQAIRTLDIAEGRGFLAPDNDEARSVAIIGADVATQLFAGRPAVGQTIHVGRHPYTVIGRLRRKQQDSNYSGPDNDKVFVPFEAMRRDFPRADAEPGVVSDILVTPRPEVLAAMPAILDARTGRIDDIDWPIERDIRRILATRHRFDPDDRDAISAWDTSLESMMMDSMIGAMTRFFLVVGLVTLGLGGLGVMNIMLVAVRERTREIGLRKALGATSGEVQRQFFLEGFALTFVSGLSGFAVAVGLCALVNLVPMPARFQGLVLTWPSGLLAIGVLVLVGVVTSTYPARRAAALPPVEALRAEV